MQRARMWGLAVCLLAAGCDDSQNPLSDPGRSPPDQRLIGVWMLQGTKKGEVEYYHVGRAGPEFPAGMLRIVAVKQEDGQLDPPEQYLAFPTVLDGKNYLNAILQGERKVIDTIDAKGWKPGLVESYTFLKYQVEGDKLLVWLIDEDVKRQAVAGGQVKGVLKTDTPPLLTDSSENVARFVAQSGDKLFKISEPERFTRLKAGAKP